MRHNYRKRKLENLKMTNSSTGFQSEGFKSHCWEPDGSFHIVCIFVIGMSSVCVILTAIAVYRIGEMVLQLIRRVKGYFASIDNSV